jgi:putative DNA primase/helicase
MDFPVGALGDILGGAVRGIVDIVKCPTALTVGSVLSTASLAVMGHADVLHPVDGAQDEPHKVPLSLFMLGVGDSGERKSASDRLASSPIKERERELNLNHICIQNQYRIDLRAWDLARQARESAEEVH